MFISKWIIPASDIPKLGFPDTYGMHKLIYQLFPGHRRSFLFSIDNIPRKGKQVLMLSQYSPQPAPVGSLFSKEVPDRFWDFNRYRFRIKLNTAKRNPSDRKMGPIPKEELIPWAIEKLNRIGVHIDEKNMHLNRLYTLKFRKSNNTVTLFGGEFSGILDVLNRDDFKEGVAKGIGKGKAFGFGLLELAPINS